jgi:hypothetical protein
VEPENLCFMSGGQCWGACPAGWTPAPEYSEWCPVSKKCCVQDVTSCIEAGGAQVVGPDPTPCCEGLVTLPMSKPNEDGGCDTVEGASVCSACPDGACDDWENWCNCPGDCSGVEPVGCDPWQEDSMPCPGGQFCKVPPHTCGTPPYVGQCQSAPGSCPAIDDPVCDCNGTTWSNACEADLNAAAIAYKGNCKVPANCTGLGGSAAVDLGSTSKCCGDLTKVQISISLDGVTCVVATGYACVYCGDLLCGPSETFCNCPEDCPAFTTPG